MAKPSLRAVQPQETAAQHVQSYLSTIETSLDKLSASINMLRERVEKQKAEARKLQLL
jgi:peptidoglycan hydrolase CwlO-like protein